MVTRARLRSPRPALPSRPPAHLPGGSRVSRLLAGRVTPTMGGVHDDPSARASSLRARAPTDTWVAAARAGDETALEAIYDELRPRVYSVCYRICQDAAQAHDLTQETFLRAFRHLDTLEDPARLRGWLTRIAVNTALMDLRSRRALGATVAEIVSNAFLDLFGSRLPSPEIQVVGRQTDEEVRQALACLPPRERMVLSLNVLEGMNLTEISAALSLSRGAVKMAACRARARLRAIFAAGGRGAERP